MGRAGNAHAAGARMTAGVSGGRGGDERRGGRRQAEWAGVLVDWARHGRGGGSERARRARRREASPHAPTPAPPPPPAAASADEARRRGGRGGEEAGAARASTQARAAGVPGEIMVATRALRPQSEQADKAMPNRTRPCRRAVYYHYYYYFIIFRTQWGVPAPRPGVGPARDSQDSRAINEIERAPAVMGAALW